MPEGDSVYRQCKMLREALEGAVIESSDFRVPALATSDVSGRTVVAVVPRGKHILIRLSAAPDAEQVKSGAEPLTLHSHLMMDGTWRVFDRQQDDAAARPGGRRSRPGASPYRPRGQARRGGSVRSAAEARTRLSADVALGQGSHTIRAILPVSYTHLRAHETN